MTSGTLGIVRRTGEVGSLSYTLCEEREREGGREGGRGRGRGEGKRGLNNT